MSTLASAQDLTDRYTEERPVTIVCDWDKPPYEFLDDEGLPAGSNIDVMRAVMGALHLPVRFVMKEWRTAIMTFERGDADLILANGSRFANGDTWAVSHNIVNYNRMCAAVTSDSIKFVPTSALTNNGAVFKPGSFSTHFFRDDSLSFSAIELQQPKVALMGLLSGDYKYFVWGEEPIKWKIRELNLSGVYIAEVDIPVSEIHIIGRDHDLVTAVDNQYSMLKQSGEVEMLQNRWLHPERARGTTSPLVFSIGLGLIILAILCYMITRLARSHVHNAASASTQLNDMMQRALHMGNFDVMEYDIRHDLFTNAHGTLLPQEGMSLADFTARIHPDQREVFRTRMQRLIDGLDRRFDIDKRWNAGSDKQPRWLNFHAHLLVEHDRKGRPQYIVNAIHDVTSIVEEDKTTLDIRRKYYRLEAQPLVAMSFYDSEGFFVGANELMRRLCRFDDPDTERFWHTMSIFDIPAMRGVITRTTTTDVFTCSHLRYPEMDIDNYIENSISPVFNAKGELVYYFVTATDITNDRNTLWQLQQMEHEILSVSKNVNQTRERLDFMLSVSDRTLESDGKQKRVVTNVKPIDEARQRLARLTEVAKDSGRMKSAFMASMTHELRTPLNAIVGFSNILEAVGDCEERAEYVRIIQNNSEMLQRLINDVIESSSFATDVPITIHPRQVDFALAFEDIFMTLNTRMTNPAIAFIKDNPYTTYPVSLDVERIQQVLTNFVINAIKFTESGHIRLGYREQDGGLYFYCEDTGRGIPKDKQSSIFQRFVKLDEFVQGTGLGLAVSKSIAARMGGRIGVNSEGLGHGSTFWIWIPLTNK